MRKQKSFDSSSEDEEEQRTRPRRTSKDIGSSADSDANSKTTEKQSPKSRLLRQMERELAKEKLSGSESDELVPIRSSTGVAGPMNSDFSYVFYYIITYEKSVQYSAIINKKILF